MLSRAALRWDKDMPDSLTEQPKPHRKKGNFKPKGRLVQAQALQEINQHLNDARPLRADMLIEYLHILQDHYGHLSAAHLAALAAEMKMPMAAIWEVASFYDHFDLV